MESESTPKTRIANAFFNYVPKVGRGNKIDGFRRRMPYTYFDEFDDLVDRWYQECS